jgi:hypothetical protein
VFVRDGLGNWTEQQKLVPSDGAASDQFGFVVSVSGDTALIGARADDDKGNDSGSAYVFARDGSGNWVEQQKLTASDGALNDLFGSAVSLSGDTAVVTAFGDDDTGVDSSSVYVFSRDSMGNWSQQQKLTASDGAAGDGFGSSVSVDDDAMVIGAYRDDDQGFNSGSAYVYARDGMGTWIELQKLIASDGALSDEFGASVAIDGDNVVVGAFRDDDNGADSGSAYVFVREFSGWVEQGKLTASDGAAGDLLGFFSISLAGNTALVGAPLNEGNGSGSGSAYVFEFGPNVLQVVVDIKPGDGTNCINNNGSGVIPVAILGSADFDVRTVDAGTVQLQGMGVRVAGRSAKLLAHFEDVNMDSYEDLVVQIEDLDGTFEEGQTTATVTALLLDGVTPIQGSDSICIVP